jgi:reverse gyrase
MSERYRFSLTKSMELAQTLFELGFITYHRTDYLRVSDAGLSLARSYIKEEFGEEFYRGRRWAEGGAHECIRPTKPIDPEELRALVLSGQVNGLNREHLLMYERIFRRFIASQMRETKLRRKELIVSLNSISREISIYTDVVEEGFNKVYPVELMPDIEGDVDISHRKELKEQPRAYLFTQGSIVEEMKRKGIGRPSTYATVVSKLIDRGYVIDRKGFLIPTKLGKEVYEFLKRQEHILPFVSEDFTRELESMMDTVEEGREDYKNILNRLYKDIIEFEEIVRR